MTDLHSITTFVALELKRLLATNQFASGGLLLMLLGTATAVLRNAPKQAWDWAMQRLILTVRVSSDDRTFDWFTVWLSKQPVQQKLRDLTLSSPRDLDAGGFKLGNQDTDPRAVLKPASGRFLVRHAGRKFWFYASRERMQNQNSVLTGFHETLTIQTLFTNRVALETLVQSAYAATVTPEDPRIEVMAPRWGNEWYTVARAKPRAAASLVYADRLFERVLEDCQHFLASESWYNDMGIPWRRGYLLHGPPGNGKSSLITALAGQLKRDVCVLNLASLGLSDENLTNLLANAPDGSLILLEDVDAVFQGRTRSSGNDSKISFNGLLNALDGVTAQQGRMVFMSTNHLEQLDPALVRPGRTDMHVHVGNANQDQVSRMLLRFFPELQDQAASLAARIQPGVLSMAKLQEHLLQHRHDAHAAVAHWAELEDASLAKA